ncbi:MAG: hypothetical protein EZS28_033042 [Streblomastix strix]|uniref:PABC domain-containing protein n=1 Tax=Streblomastix strix TaxID=222440 RepID=A0A5J4UN26_9EUKA|nr:MAG: hypothetical protein EZS28_033042 [Streblomastix strix]
MEEYLTMASRGEDIQSNIKSSITGTIAYWNDAEPHNQGQYWYFWLQPSGKFSSHSEPWICLVVDENIPSIDMLKTAAESKSNQEFELNVLIMPRQPDYLQFVVSKDDEVKQIFSRVPTIKVSDLNGIQLNPIIQPTETQLIQIHPVEEWILIVKWIGDLYEDDLKLLFNPLGAESVVMLKTEVETYERQAQINFKTQLDAQTALDQTNNKIIKGSVLEIEMQQQQINDQIKCLGELLYEQIEKIDKLNAGKITDILLEHDIQDLVKMLEDPHQLLSKVQKAKKDLGIAVANEQAPLGSIKPEVIFPDQETAHQQGNAIIHALDNYNHTTIAYKPVITKGIVRFEGIFYNYKDFPYQIGISESSVTFIPKKEPGDLL